MSLSINNWFDYNVYISGIKETIYHNLVDVSVFLIETWKVQSEFFKLKCKFRNGVDFSHCGKWINLGWKRIFKKNQDGIG